MKNASEIIPGMPTSAKTAIILAASKLLIVSAAAKYITAIGSENAVYRNFKQIRNFKKHIGVGNG